MNTLGWIVTIIGGFITVGCLAALALGIIIARGK